MTKDVNAEIAALETEEEKEVKKELNQVKAALEGLRAVTGDARDKAFAEAGLYADRWTWEELKAELGRLRDYLTELRKKENLLLEARLEERTSRDSMLGRRPPVDDEANELVTPQRERRLFKVSALFVKGATWRDLRKTMFKLADLKQGIKGFIRYTDPGKTDSDLELLLFFVTRALADAMYESILGEYFQHYSSGTRPTVVVSAAGADEVVDPEAFMRTSDYDRNTSPQRDNFDVDRDDTQSHGSATKNCPDHVQRRECIFDPQKCSGKMHAAHINAKIKNTKADSEGNIIPLPADVHQAFDDNLSALGIPLFSIEPRTTVEELGTGVSESGDFFQDVKVRVHFFPHPGVRQYIQALRTGAMHISDGVYELTIGKRDAKEFIKQASQRHADTLLQWSEGRP